MAQLKGSNFDLLLVEDNPADAELAGAHLESLSQYSFALRVVPSLREAIDVLHAEAIDAVVLDLNLPDSRGVETLRRLRQAHDDVAIVVTSGFDDDADYAEAMREGAQDCLRKDDPAVSQLGRSVVYAVERFRAEQAHRQVRQLVAANPDAVIVVDHSGVVQFVNDAALELFGRTREDFVGELLGFFVGPEGPFEIEIVRRGGRRIGEMRVAEIEWQGRRAVLTSIRDVTETRLLAEQLRQAQKMEAIGWLAGGIAHDFNNLLVVITSNVDFLLDACAENDPRREMVQQVEQAAERAQILTSQLLYFSRRQPSQPAPLDPNDVVQESFRMLRRGLPEDIEMACLLAEHPWSVRADPTQLNQLLMNLVVNAKQAMTSGGRLQIDVANLTLHVPLGVLGTGEYVRLRVSDNGGGIAHENLTRIFEPFFTTKEAGIGTGLGLAISHRIARQAGGDITVESELGKGSTFTVLLPRCHEAPERPADSRHPGAQLRGSETILVVEDDAAVAHTVTRALKLRGFNVLRAANGEQAKRLIERAIEPIDLVLADVVMPQMGGRELSDWLAATRPDMRLLFVTGYSEDAAILLADANGKRALLLKPFLPAQLARSVRDMLDGRG